MRARGRRCGRGRARRSARRRGWSRPAARRARPSRRSVRGAAPSAARRRSRSRGRRRSRRRGRSSGLRISARAIASRCRCPPEKFVPPWATGGSRPPSSSRRRSRAACATSSASHISLLGGVGLAVARGWRRRSRRTGTPSAAPARCAPRGRRCGVAHVDAVDADRAAGRVEQARDEVDQRRLAGAGRADDRGGLARLGREGQVVQHGVLARPGSGTRRPRSSTPARSPVAAGATGLGGRHDGRLGVEDLADALGRRRRRGAPS